MVNQTLLSNLSVTDLVSLFNFNESFIDDDKVKLETISEKTLRYANRNIILEIGRRATEIFGEVVL